ncbi:MAG: ATP-binding protein, partial [Chloroflexota bacterium]|nr:ATP-binding protein [Chloroflexota bacterium]
RRAAYRLRLAVDEIATNAILHGYQSAGREGDVRVEADIDADTLTIVLEDTGDPFNPLQHDTPDEEELGQPLEEREIGGLGVFLALQGVDEFRHEHTGQRNRNVFVVRRPGAAEKQATSKEESP